MSPSQIRNVAIIAHVDHGKTTLVDRLFRDAKLFRDNQEVAERLMDSLDLERERGITILAKNGALSWREHRINIIDTPGHADFGGQVERVLRMADGCLLLVDAAEGPMPQTFFVLRKALSLHLPVIVVINKIDKPAARPDWTVDQVFDLFVKLDAPSDILDFPIIYASARDGYASLDSAARSGTVAPLLDLILEKIPPPKGDADAPVQMLVSTIVQSQFFGRLAIGKITQGRLAVNQEVAVAHGDEIRGKGRIPKLYRFRGKDREEIAEAGVGEVVAVSGFEDVTVGETITDPLNPAPLPPPQVDPPTVSMMFLPNDSPFSGREGQFVTSRHLKERLDRETLSDVALHVEDAPGAFKVSGRGELHLAILIETMRREGYEFQVSRPEVIVREEGGRKLEPYEELITDVEDAHVGTVIELLGRRRAQLLDMSPGTGLTRMRYRIPTRGLLGFRGDFLTATRGMGMMSYVFSGYDAWAGEMRHRTNGVLIAMEEATTVAYALQNLEPRGRLFLGAGESVYGGQILGEHNRDNDLVVNPAKGKKLSNMRAVGTDDAVILTPPVQMTLEKCLDFIADDELVEVTPKAIRLRKRQLDALARKRNRVPIEA